MGSKLDALLKISIVLFASASVGYYFLVSQRDTQIDAARVQEKQQAETAKQAQQECQVDAAADAQIPLENPYGDRAQLEAEAAKILNQDFQAVDCQKNDLVTRAIDQAIDALLNKVSQPDELCDRYRRKLSGVAPEVQVSLTLAPGVSVSVPVKTEKLCDLVPRVARCPK